MNQAEAITAERRAYGWLKCSLPEAYRGKNGDGCDVFYKGKRIEIKSAPYRDGEWKFNIHRHGVLNEEGLHCYIMRLEDVPGSRYAIHLVIPAPLGVKGVAISFRSLLTRYARYFNRLDYIEPSLDVSNLADDSEELSSIDGPEVRTQRDATGLSRSELADMAGVSALTIYNVERGLGGDGACSDIVADAVSRVAAVPLGELYPDAGEPLDHFGSELRRQRERFKLSMADFAQISRALFDPGISKEALSIIERGRTKTQHSRTKNVIYQTLNRIADMKLAEVRAVLQINGRVA